MNILGFMTNRPKPALHGITGSFIRGRDGNWWVAFKVPLVAAYDWIMPDKAQAWQGSQIAMFEALNGHEAQIDVLPLPVTREDRVGRLIEAEDATDEQRTDPIWVAERSAEAGRLADRLASRKYGDSETVGLLWVNLGREVPAPTLTETRFAMRTPADRFYIEHHADSGLIEPAKHILTELDAAWPGIVPASPQLIDRTLTQMVWPGHNEIDPPNRPETQSGDTELVLQFFGQADYTDTKPYLVEVDYYGTPSYVSCLPLRPLVNEMNSFEGEKGREYAFQTYSGRRVRFTWRITVMGGKQLLTEAHDNLSDVEIHSERQVKAGVNPIEYRRQIAAARAMYEHLHGDGQVVVGRPMLIAAANSEEELTAMRAALVHSVKATGFEVIPDNQIQRQLLMAAFPGSKPYSRYQRIMGLGLAASGMPFVTTDPQMAGSSLQGFTMGLEVCPVFGSLGDAVLANRMVAPSCCLCGPSQRGKTTALLDWLIPMAMRDWIVHVYDLAKFDIDVLDASLLPPGLSINLVDLLEHPGCLNPVLLKALPKREKYPTESEYNRARDEERVEAMAGHLSKMCGQQQDWVDSWDRPLRAACAYVLNAAYEAAPGMPQDEVIPNLYLVLDRLRSGKGGFEGESDLATRLSKPLSDRAAADITCSNASIRDLQAELAEPGLHVIQQKGLVLPDAAMAPENYDPKHHLALATLDLAGVLSHAVANARGVRVAIGHVEYHVTSRLSKGANVADFLARVGAALETVTVYDTQLPTDLSENLAAQVTGWGVFTPNPGHAPTSLKAAGIEVTPLRVAKLMNLINPRWTAGLGPQGLTKGGMFYRPSTMPDLVVALQVGRFYIGQAFLTNRSERAARTRGR